MAVISNAAILLFIEKYLLMMIITSRMKVLILFILDDV